MRPSEIIKSPIQTEKTVGLYDRNVYTFKVDKRANKIEIAKAIEFIFQVKVDRVNVINVDRKPKKLGRFAGFVLSYKKAIVFLKEGSSINYFNEEEAAPTTVVETKEKVVSDDKKAEAEAKVKAKLEAKKAKKDSKSDK